MREVTPHPSRDAACGRKREVFAFLADHVGLKQMSERYRALHTATVSRIVARSFSMKDGEPRLHSRSRIDAQVTSYGESEDSSGMVVICALPIVTAWATPSAKMSSTVASMLLWSPSMNYGCSAVTLPDGLFVGAFTSPSSPAE